MLIKNAIKHNLYICRAGEKPENHEDDHMIGPGYNNMVRIIFYTGG